MANLVESLVHHFSHHFLLANRRVALNWRATAASGAGSSESPPAATAHDLTSGNAEGQPTASADRTTGWAPMSFLNARCLKQLTFS